LSPLNSKALRLKVKIRIGPALVSASFQAAPAVKFAQIKDMTLAELAARSRDFRREIFNLRLRTVRKDIAHIETGISALDNKASKAFRMAEATNKGEVTGKCKQRVGKVVQNKMTKTIVVRVQGRFPQSQYKKIVTSYKKFYAHDEKAEAKISESIGSTSCRNFIGSW
jgi:ribosomal protein S17/ribosomal protein L29